MSVVTQLTPDQKSRAVTLRINRQTRTAQFDGIQAAYYGDTLYVIIDGTVGVDPDDMQLWLWKKEAGQAITDRLVYANDFAPVAGSPSRAFKEIAFTSTNLRDALAATPVGTALTCRLIVRDGDMVILDTDYEVFNNPFIGVTPAPDETDPTANPYLRRDDFAAWAAARLLEPLETMDDMAAMINKILVKLSDVTA
jgi:hypothetical protein